MSYEELSKKELIEALQEMEETLAETEEEKNDWENKAKKFKADFENYKKKEPERKQKWQRLAEEKLAEDMIEVMDNLERAIASAKEDSVLLQGVKIVADQLYESLQNRGLERIDAEGQEFDPNYHKAVETQEHDEHNLVLEEKRKGYRFDDKVLREAEVVVGKSGK